MYRLQHITQKTTYKSRFQPEIGLVSEILAPDTVRQVATHILVWVYEFLTSLHPKYLFPHLRKTENNGVFQLKVSMFFIIQEEMVYHFNLSRIFCAV